MEIHTKNIIEFTRNIIDKFGPRAAGSPESRGCTDALAAAVGPFADSLNTEDFTFSPGAFLGWIRILVAAYTLALGCMWMGWYLVSSLLLLGAVVLLVFQFFLYKEVLDPLYPKFEGRNVLASLEPEGEVRGELMISGHHDSARIFNFLVHQPKLYALRVNGGIGSLLALTLMNIILLIISLAGINISWAWIPAMVLTVLLVLILQLWFFASKTHTPGAGDNLVSSVTAIEYLKICTAAKKSGEGFKHLRITAVSWDAEEAGLRGSRAWRKSREADPLQYPVWNLNLECLYDDKALFMMTSDINGSVQLSHSLAERCARLLTDITDRDIQKKPIGFLAGGTDAGETAKAGVEATTLMGMSFSIDALSSVYHTPKDTIDAVSVEAVEAALTLADALAKELDGEISG
jgi:hypothetical protein